MSKPVTAASVRAYFRDGRMDRLSPEAQVTVAENSRGRLHAEAVKTFNKGRKPHRQYVLGATKQANAEREAQRAKAASLGVKVGKAGPLSAAAKEVLAQSKG